VTKAAETHGDVPEQLLAYVTRVDPASDTPIRVTHAKGVTLGSASPDDYIVAA
jgi:hypothetical protein